MPSSMVTASPWGQDWSFWEPSYYKCVLLKTHNCRARIVVGPDNSLLSAIPDHPTHDRIRQIIYNYDSEFVLEFDVL